MADPLFDLSDKVTVVTGASGVLCGAMAQELGERGAKVALLSRSKDKLEARADEIRAKGGEAQVFPCDVTDAEGMQAVAEQIVAKWGRVDILVNGAGGNHPDATTGNKAFFDLPMDAFKFVFDLNLIGTVLPCQVFGRIMAEQEEGVILNVSSMSAEKPLTRVVGYSAAKSAVNCFTEWLATHMAKEYSPKIRVNALSPGFFLTEQNRFLLTTEDGGLTERGQSIINATPQGRFGEPDELFSAMVYLLSDGARFVTGSVIPVDGGFSAFGGV